ncbi:uncharacterized protein V1513DRAFT_428357 [Lipomyces chichibuensis]|uniref:uncharacterized protein n=1 Tax=Lipomyces chichibuensis TaxID=1546026 RepID=UPI0033431682
MGSTSAPWADVLHILKFDPLCTPSDDHSLQMKLSEHTLVFSGLTSFINQIMYIHFVSVIQLLLLRFGQFAAKFVQDRKVRVWKWTIKFKLGLWTSKELIFAMLPTSENAVGVNMSSDRKFPTDKNGLRMSYTSSVNSLVWNGGITSATDIVAKDRATNINIGKWPTVGLEECRYRTEDDLVSSHSSILAKRQQLFVAVVILAFVLQ